MSELTRNTDERKSIINNEYWLSNEDIELLDNIRDMLYCKYAIKEELENRNCSVDMCGIEYWAKKFEEIRKKIKI